MSVTEISWPTWKKPPSESHNSILCPICGTPTSVVNSRPTKLNSIRRRRSCLSGHRFTTTEIIGDISMRNVAERIRPGLGQLINLLDDLLLSPPSKEP